MDQVQTIAIVLLYPMMSLICNYVCVCVCVHVCVWTCIASYTGTIRQSPLDYIFFKVMVNRRMQQ